MVWQWKARYSYSSACENPRFSVMECFYYCMLLQSRCCHILICPDFWVHCAFSIKWLIVASGWFFSFLEFWFVQPAAGLLGIAGGALFIHYNDERRVVLKGTPFSKPVSSNVKLLILLCRKLQLRKLGGVWIQFLFFILKIEIFIQNIRTLTQKA